MRREVITLLGGATVAWPLAGRTQTRPKMLRVGAVSPNPRTFVAWVTFERRMRELGYAEGQNLAVEYIHVGNRSDRYDEAMRELVRRKIDVIVTSNDLAVKAAVAATSSVPIVMIAVAFDPVERGIVTSIARPTGNVTGVFFRRPELVEKQMEVFAETFPERTRLGVLWDSNSANLFERPSAWHRCCVCGFTR